MVTSVVTNNADIGREAEFDVILPAEAFIVNMTMTLPNETIVGEVREKKKAKKIYEKVSSSCLVGQSGGVEHSAQRCLCLINTIAGLFSLKRCLAAFASVSIIFRVPTWY